MPTPSAIKRRNNYLRRNYGITTSDYNNMFLDQDGCCAICGLHQSDIKRPLVVDHCHSTRKVRGLLCNDCNLGLGIFKDDIDSLGKAIDYLDKSRKR